MQETVLDFCHQRAFRMKITYTKELLASMSIFTRITGAELKDAFEHENALYFVVQPGQMGKAIGRGGATVKELQERFKRHIRIIEYCPDIIKFIQNVIYPLKVEGMTEESGVITIKSEDRALKGQLIGRNAKNLNMLRDVVSRYFKVTEIRIE
ncbi:MAG TPA: NusA-like transcription termination signal-binding factor [Candidatus Nanoarchaeia archaeon]|nr:NusA-like transcription termination signal-binding factor [Candidatus Nanoarchaeia archaeon]